MYGVGSVYVLLFVCVLIGVLISCIQKQLQIRKNMRLQQEMTEHHQAFLKDKLNHRMEQEKDGDKEFTRRIKNLSVSL